MNSRVLVDREWGISYRECMSLGSGTKSMMKDRRREIGETEEKRDWRFTTLGSSESGVGRYERTVH